MYSVNDIREKVHELYWKKQGSCAKTMLLCLGELTDVKLEPQVFVSAAGLLGAQCGLAIAGQMFIGIYYRQLEREDAAITSSCAQYAEVFRNKFTSLVCSVDRLQ